MDLDDSSDFEEMCCGTPRAEQRAHLSRASSFTLLYYVNDKEVVSSHTSQSSGAVIRGRRSRARGERTQHIEIETRVSTPSVRLRSRSHQTRNTCHSSGMSYVSDTLHPQRGSDRGSKDTVGDFLSRTKSGKVRSHASDRSSRSDSTSDTISNNSRSEGRDGARVGTECLGASRETGTCALSHSRRTAQSQSITATELRTTSSSTTALERKKKACSVAYNFVWTPSPYQCTRVFVDTNLVNSNGSSETDRSDNDSIADKDDHNCKHNKSDERACRALLSDVDARDLSCLMSYDAAVTEKNRDSSTGASAKDAVHNLKRAEAAEEVMIAQADGGQQGQHKTDRVRLKTRARARSLNLLVAKSPGPMSSYSAAGMWDEQPRVHTRANDCREQQGGRYSTRDSVCGHCEIVSSMTGCRSVSVRSASTDRRTAHLSYGQKTAFVSHSQQQKQEQLQKQCRSTSVGAAATADSERSSTAPCSSDVQQQHVYMMLVCSKPEPLIVTDFLSLIILILIPLNLIVLDLLCLKYIVVFVVRVPGSTSLASPVSLRWFLTALLPFASSRWCEKNPSHAETTALTFVPNSGAAIHNLNRLTPDQYAHTQSSSSSASLSMDDKVDMCPSGSAYTVSAVTLWGTFVLWLFIPNGLLYSFKQKVCDRVTQIRSASAPHVAQRYSHDCDARSSDGENCLGWYEVLEYVCPELRRVKEWLSYMIDIYLYECLFNRCEAA